VVFIDPPYSLGIEKEIMKALKKSSILTGETIVIIEADVNNALEGITELGFDVYKEKIYKTNKHVFYRLTDGEDGDSV
jgi:16S rRNA (guanine966-N2)-methyltransferase